jgi:hypothetical protein
MKLFSSISKSHVLRSSFTGLATLSLLGACSGADGSLTDAADEAGVIEAGDGELGELSLALDSDANCGEATADKTYTSIISPTFTSPSSYSAGRNGCSRAYFVRVNNYRNGNTSKYNMFEYAGPMPGTASACENTRLMVYAFERKSDGTAVFVESKSAYGEPDFFIDTGEYAGCTLPWIATDSMCTDLNGGFNLTTGKNYQFAVSARSNNNTNPVMQPIRMKNGPKVRCQPH